MNVTNWNGYVISVIHLKYNIDVTVQRNCTLHVLYSEMTQIKSAAMYESGLFGLIISHCNAMYKCKFNIHSSVHCSNSVVIITNKIQLGNGIYYSSVRYKLNMFRAIRRPSSGASTATCSLWFTYVCGDRP